MTIDRLYDWRARRAGGRITITHRTGKIVGVDVIEAQTIGMKIAVIAIDKDGRKYELNTDY